jgi:ferritin-like metal-binding protein YciE
VPDTIREQLVKYLTDVHSIEEQALTQLRRAPEIAGSQELASAFEQHLSETEGHERRVRERLEAHDAAASTIKDAAGKAGGVAMVLFAKFNPDTPGKLINHAYSYEHMELAAYELLARVAERAEDEETRAMAQEIAGEEREMAARLEAGFDAAVAASLRDNDPDDLGDQLNAYLADAHAIESQSIALLEGGQKLVGDDGIAELFDEHLAETRAQQERLQARLDARGSSPSRIKDVGLRLGGFNLGGFFGAQPDTPAKLTGFAFAFEHLEIAGYEQLGRVADRAGDPEAAELAELSCAEERRMAARLAEHWDAALDAALRAQGVMAS